MRVYPHFGFDFAIPATSSLISTMTRGGDVPPAVEFARVATAPVITLRQQTHRCQEISVVYHFDFPQPGTKPDAML